MSSTQPTGQKVHEQSGSQRDQKEVGAAHQKAHSEQLEKRRQRIKRSGSDDLEEVSCEYLSLGNPHSTVIQRTLVGAQEINRHEGKKVQTGRQPIREYFFQAGGSIRFRPVEGTKVSSTGLP